MWIVVVVTDAVYSYGVLKNSTFIPTIILSSHGASLRCFVVSAKICWHVHTRSYEGVSPFSGYMTTL